MNKQTLLDLIAPAFLCHEIGCKPTEQIINDLADNIMKAYEQPDTPIPTVDEDIRMLRQIRNYFGENDKAIFNHTAYDFLNSFIKKLNK